jgi:hypothetical protein
MDMAVCRAGAKPRKGGKIAVKDLNKLLNESYKSKNKTLDRVDNYELDKELSTDKTKIYKDITTGDIKMVNRGTSDINDVITDAKLLFGFKNNNRYNEGRQILQKVKEKYPDKSIDLLGHSLGASVAEDIGNDPQVKNIITLNKPTTPMDLFRKSKINDKQYDIRTSRDVVSMLQPIQKDENDLIIPSESKNLYTEHKIDVLDRLDQDKIIGTGFKINGKLKTLSNIELTKLIYKLKLPLNNIIMRDETDLLEKDGFYIINLDKSTGNGTHWTVLYFHPLKSYYNDSFGFVAPIEVEKKIKPYLYNNKDIQDWNSSACGWYCLAFIKFLHDKQNKEIAFKEFLKMFKTKTTENDDILYKYLTG